MLTFEKHPLTFLLWRRGKRCSLTQEDTLNAVPGACSWIRKAPSRSVEETTGGRVEEHFEGWENCKSWQAGTSPCLLSNRHAKSKGWLNHLHVSCSLSRNVAVGPPEPVAAHIAWGKKRKTRRDGDGVPPVDTTTFGPRKFGSNNGW